MVHHDEYYGSDYCGYDDYYITEFDGRAPDDVQAFLLFRDTEGGRRGTPSTRSGGRSERFQP